MDALIAEFPRFVGGFFGTLRISLIAAVVALVLGTLLAAFRVSPVAPLRWIGTAWVTGFRSSPLAVMLFVCAFALPQLGVVLAFTAPTGSAAARVAPVLAGRVGRGCVWSQPGRSSAYMPPNMLRPVPGGW